MHGYVKFMIDEARKYGYELVTVGSASEIHATTGTEMPARVSNLVDPARASSATAIPNSVSASATSSAAARPPPNVPTSASAPSVTSSKPDPSQGKGGEPKPPEPQAHCLRPLLWQRRRAPIWQCVACSALSVAEL